MRRKKEDYLVIVLAVILLIVVFGIVISLLIPQQSKQQTETNINPTSAITQTPLQTPEEQPTPTDEIGANPPVQYSTNDQDKLIDKIQNRTPLTQSDSSAKATILAALPQGEQSGVLYTTNNIVIDYTYDADLFQVEIETTNIAQAKAEATVWFQSQGISQQAMCYLPVMFYLNYDVAQQIKESKTNVVFSPLAEGC